MAYPKKHVHRVVLAVTFDKPCSAEYALREVRDCIHGDFYPTQRSDDEPGIFRVKSIKALRRAEMADNQ